MGGPDPFQRILDMTRVRTEAIDELLPQMQCTRCGYLSCRDYAEALARGRTSINRCPPGGEATINSLARLLKVRPVPLDVSCGTTRPLAVAFIDESWCIGCTICIKACPVDAIVGAAKHMHTVLAMECTGCELCVQPCPTDCIEMQDVPSHPQHEHLTSVWTPARATSAKNRFDARKARLQRTKDQRAARVKRASLRHADAAAKKRAIDAAVARVRETKNNTGAGDDE